MPACRSCNSPLNHSFVDLGVSPLANSYLRISQLGKMEPFYPLHAFVCEACFLVQLDEFESPEHIFSDYAYFSSYSETWVRHCKHYAENMIKRFQLGPSSFVGEVASNDGYLLKNFLAHQIPLLGVEPAQNVAAVANSAGIRTHCAFFGEALGRELRKKFAPADVIAANNVLAHVPRLNDFISGFREWLAPEGVATFEFPHFLQLLKNCQFDTIYHEHFSYISFLAAARAFERNGLRIFDADELATHGGSLRLYICHEKSQTHIRTPKVGDILRAEISAGLDKMETYSGFAAHVERIKYDLLRFLIEARESGKRVAAYGAPAKGNTMLNYCGIRTDLIEFTVDLSPHKQGTYLPGARIPVLPPQALIERKPDYVLILPWNLEAEITEQWSAVRAWGGRFVVSHPKLRISQ